MKTISISELCYSNVDFNITDIFPERWLQRKEFSWYKTTPRPCSALFFVCSDIKISFFRTDGTLIITAQNGDIVFIPQDSCYYARVSGVTGKKIDSFTINLHFYDEQRNELLLYEQIALLSCCSDNRLESSLKNLSNSFHQKKRNLAKIKGDFFLILDLIRSFTTQNNDFYYPIHKGAEAFCEEWNKDEKIEKYAQMSGVSVTYFYRCFKKWSGYTPAEYRNILRLSNAESLLRCTDIKIQEISEITGYQNPYYFSRLFTEAYGLSPKHYRERHQKE